MTTSGCWAWEIACVMHFNNGDEDVADGDVMMMRLAHDDLIDDALMMTAPSFEVVNKRAAHGRQAGPS